MNFILEERSSISSFVTLLKTVEAMDPSIFFSVTPSGWYLFNRTEHFNRPEDLKMGTIALFKPSFFTNYESNMNETLTFDFDFVSLLKSIHSQRRNIKKMIFEFKVNDTKEEESSYSSRELLIKVLIYMEEFHIIYEDKVNLEKNPITAASFNERINAYKSDKEKLLQVPLSSLEFLKDFRNNSIDWTFDENCVTVQANSYPKKLLVKLTRDAISKYDYGTVQLIGSNCVTFPQNMMFLSTFFIKKSHFLTHNLDIFVEPYPSSTKRGISVLRVEDEKAAVLFAFGVGFDRNENEGGNFGSIEKSMYVFGNRFSKVEENQESANEPLREVNKFLSTKESENNMNDQNIKKPEAPQRRDHEELSRRKRSNSGSDDDNGRKKKVKRAMEARNIGKKVKGYGSLPVLGSAKREKLVDGQESEDEDKFEGKGKVENYSEKQKATNEKLSKKIKLNVFK